MTRRIIPFSLLFLLISIVWISNSLPNFGKAIFKVKKGEEIGIVFAQDVEKEKKRKEPDSHYISILKQLRAKVDGWLKSLNDRIEREDITRFEVRFLEILRNILEWVKEKLDEKIEAKE